jgi:hypothetical protein
MRATRSVNGSTPMATAVSTRSRSRPGISKGHATTSRAACRCISTRLSLDPANKDILRNEITVFDHALTRPWTVTKHYHRIRKVEWHEDLCSESNNHVVIGKENYFLSADGFLMPAKKDQAPPDLRYFKQTRK